MSVITTVLLAEISQHDVEEFKTMVITVTQNARTKMEDAANRATIAFGKRLFVVCFTVANDIDRPCSISIPLLTLQYLVLYIAGLTIRWGRGAGTKCFFGGVTECVKDDDRHTKTLQERTQKFLR